MTDIVDYLRKRLIDLRISTHHYGSWTWNRWSGHWER